MPSHSNLNTLNHAYIHVNYEATSHFPTHIWIRNAFLTCKCHFRDNKHELNQASLTISPLYVFLEIITQLHTYERCQIKGKSIKLSVSTCRLHKVSPLDPRVENIGVTGAPLKCEFISGCDIRNTLQYISRVEHKEKPRNQEVRTCKQPSIDHI